MKKDILFRLICSICLICGLSSAVFVFVCVFYQAQNTTKMRAYLFAENVANYGEIKTVTFSMGCAGRDNISSAIFITSDGALYTFDFPTEYVNLTEDDIVVNPEDIPLNREIKVLTIGDSFYYRVPNDEYIHYALTLKPSSSHIFGEKLMCSQVIVSVMISCLCFSLIWGLLRMEKKQPRQFFVAETLKL